jgi:putative ABC transport system permease protein
MIRFLLTGLLRDKSRSLLPVIVVAIGVMLSVLMHAYIKGVMEEVVEQTASFTTGHVKVMTQAYAVNKDQLPNDLALLGVTELSDKFKLTFPEINWAARIRFSGLIDVPGPDGETKSQGPVSGMGIDLLSNGNIEIKRLNLRNSIMRGKMPEEQGEILMSETFSKKLGVNPGDTVTFIGSTMNGSMAFYNFRISGTLNFGNTAMDRSTVIADISDIQNALDMQDAAGEIVGFFPGGYYDDHFVDPVVKEFRKTYTVKDDEFTPVIYSMADDNSISLYLGLSKYMGALITSVFIIAMSLVLWNAGLLGGLRRYGEIGLRLAMGEEKGHIYRSMLYESVMIGIGGTFVGTLFGLFFAWLLQKYGLDIGEFTKNATASVMMPNVVRARITATDYYIGLVPGIISTFIGTALSGIGIYKRNTAQLFKELEV